MVKDVTPDEVVHSILYDKIDNEIILKLEECVLKLKSHGFDDGVIMLMVSRTLQAYRLS